MSGEISGSNPSTWWSKASEFFGGDEGDVIVSISQYELLSQESQSGALSRGEDRLSRNLRNDLFESSSVSTDSIVVAWWKSEMHWDIGQIFLETQNFIHPLQVCLSTHQTPKRIINYLWRYFIDISVLWALNNLLMIFLNIFRSRRWFWIFRPSTWWKVISAMIFEVNRKNDHFDSAFSIAVIQIHNLFHLTSIISGPFGKKLNELHPAALVMPRWPSTFLYVAAMKAGHFKPNPEKTYPESIQNRSSWRGFREPDAKVDFYQHPKDFAEMNRDFSGSHCPRLVSTCGWEG